MEEKELLDYAKDNCAIKVTGIKYAGKWKGCEIWFPEHEGNRCIGLPSPIIVQNEVIRSPKTRQEIIEIINAVYPDEDDIPDVHRTVDE